MKLKPLILSSVQVYIVTISVMIFMFIIGIMSDHSDCSLLIMSIVILALLNYIFHLRNILKEMQNGL